MMSRSISTMNSHFVIVIKLFPIVLPSMSTRSLSYPPESKRLSSFSSSTIFSSLSSGLASFLAPVDDLVVDGLLLSSALLPALLNLESGLFTAAPDPEPDGGLPAPPPRPTVGLTAPSAFLAGLDRTGGGALFSTKSNQFDLDNTIELNRRNFLFVPVLHRSRWGPNVGIPGFGRTPYIRIVWIVVRCRLHGSAGTVLIVRLERIQCRLDAGDLFVLVRQLLLGLNATTRESCAKMTISSGSSYNLPFSFEGRIQNRGQAAVNLLNDTLVVNAGRFVIAEQGGLAGQFGIFTDFGYRRSHLESVHKIRIRIVLKCMTNNDFIVSIWVFVNRM